MKKKKIYLYMYRMYTIEKKIITIKSERRKQSTFANKSVVVIVNIVFF